MPQFYYEELSKKVIGIAFDTFNQEGYGHTEKFYEDIIADNLRSREIPFQRQRPIQLVSKTGRKYFRKADFDVEAKMLVELKVGKKFLKKHFDQVNEYLLALDYRLGLLLGF